MYGLSSFCRVCTCARAKSRRPALANPPAKKEAPTDRQDYYRAYYHGLTPEQFQSLHDKQFGKCAICLRSFDDHDGNKKSRMHVDHDHLSGTIRGLLCGRCNIGLGYFQDSPELLCQAAAYLTKNATDHVEPAARVVRRTYIKD
jgi:hypothetical protein